MEYAVLGKSGVRVSRLCLGTMMFGGPTDEEESTRIIHRALDAGINFIDTANTYNKVQRPAESCPRPPSRGKTTGSGETLIVPATAPGRKRGSR